jgi:mycoredoxin
VDDATRISGSWRPGAVLWTRTVCARISNRQEYRMVTMYTTSWCGYCTRLKRAMLAEGIEFAEVNIEEDAAAADLVMNANGGNRTVPTLIFADGTALTNPSVAQVKAQLVTAS